MARTANEVKAVEAARMVELAARNAMEACCERPDGPGNLPTVIDSRKAEYAAAFESLRSAAAVLEADAFAHAYDLDNEMAITGCYSEALLAMSPLPDGRENY